MIAFKWQWSIAGEELDNKFTDVETQSCGTGQYHLSVKAKTVCGKLETGLLYLPAFSSHCAFFE